MINIEKSKPLSDKFDPLYPGGHSKFREPIDASPHKVFIDHAKGTRIWDLDGNEYVEFNGAFGPLMLGHANEEWADAVCDIIKNNAGVVGSNCFFCEDDITLGEMMCKYIPSCEALKMQLSGTEAVQMAIRIARAYTGKQIVVRFHDHYHGWIDNVFGGLLDEEADPPYAKVGTYWTDGKYTDGKFEGSIKETFLLPWNDFEKLEETFEKYHDQIAMVHFEALVCNTLGLYPKPGFLEKIRELCDKYNVVMSMDEVITGFRLGMGGAQEFFGVTPDISTFGKAMSGGMPIACVVGKKKIFDLFKKNCLRSPGTYNGYQLGMRASVAALKLYERDNFAGYKKRDEIQKTIVDGLIAAAEKYNVPLAVNDAPGVFHTIFGMTGGRIKLYTVQEAIDGGWNPDMFIEFRKFMQEEGIVMLPGERWYVGIAHTEADAEWVLRAADVAMSKVAQQIKDGFYNK